MRVQFKSVQFHSMAVHRVGNSQRAERNFISNDLYIPNEAMHELLMKYFIRPLKRANDLYRFDHPEGRDFHQLFTFAKAIFEDPMKLHSESINILEHLYRQSKHPNIKSGELFITLFHDVQYDDELCTAIGIFKSEQKHTFLKVNKMGEVFDMSKEEGININKLDKGALIINSEQQDGFRVLSVDNNQYDTHYWLHDFLQTDPVRDEVFNTFSYMDMVNNFSKEVVMPAHDKQEQVKFITDTVDYFTNNDEFNFDEFANKVTKDQETANELRAYQQNYALDEANHFTISKPAFKSARRQFKTDIKLDTNIQIKLDAGDPDASHHYLEKGYDEEKGMHFYKVYFNEEL